METSIVLLLLLFLHQLPFLCPFLLLYLLQTWLCRLPDLGLNFTPLHSPRLRLKANVYPALISGRSERNINLPLQRPYRPPPQTAAACLQTRGRNVYLRRSADAHLTPDGEESFPRVLPSSHAGRSRRRQATGGGVFREINPLTSLNNTMTTIKKKPESF